MSPLPIGLALPPDEALLDACAPHLRTVDYFEITPEAMWRVSESGALLANGYHRRFSAIQVATGLPFVAHGAGLSLGTASRVDAPRRARWLDRVRRDHATFHFRWYTERLGATALDGQAMGVAMPLPMTGQSARVVRGRLRAMQRIVPDVGVENTATCFVLGDPLDEPAFLRRVLKRRGVHLLLDLNDLVTTAARYDFDPEVYLSGLDLTRVIGLHVGGPPEVPEVVWSLLAAVRPRCKKARGVTLDTEDLDGGHIGEALERLRATCG